VRQPHAKAGVSAGAAATRTGVLLAWGCSTLAAVTRGALRCAHEPPSETRAPTPQTDPLPAQLTSAGRPRLTRRCSLLDQPFRARGGGDAIRLEPGGLPGWNESYGNRRGILRAIAQVTVAVARSALSTQASGSVEAVMPFLGLMAEFDYGSASGVAQ
jgi:hypothetical protein